MPDNAKKNISKTKVDYFTDLNKLNQESVVPYIDINTLPKSKDKKDNIKSLNNEIKQAGDSKQRFYNERTSLIPYIQQQYNVDEKRATEIAYDPNFDTKSFSRNIPQNSPDGIKQVEVQSAGSRAVDYITNPLDAFAYSVRTGDASNMPANYRDLKAAGEGLQGNVVGDVINDLNPIDAIDDTGRNIAEGDYLASLGNASRLVGLGYGTKANRLLKQRSEIDWGKWNKEILNNKTLLQEYNTIEQTSKANGTWMKYSDGSPFPGTPEQFIQMNSKNLQKYAGGVEAAEEMYKNPLYRGQRAMSSVLNNVANQNIIFTSTDKKLAGSYAKKNAFGNEVAKTKVFNPNIDNPNNPGLLQLGIPKTENILKIDAKNNFYHSIPNTNSTLAKGSVVPTDMIAYYLKNNNINQAKIDNILDYGSKASIKDIALNNRALKDTPSNVTIINQIPGSGYRLKSLMYNNGDFFKYNPDIYKALTPVTVGAAALANENNYKNGGTMNKPKNIPTWDYPSPGTKIHPTQSVPFALGGRMYNQGGPMEQLTEFNAGGSHESNPLSGIPQGTNAQGQMNLVEEGETKLNSKDYIFSDSLKVDKETLETFGLPSSSTGKTFAEVSKKINSKNDFRKNDTIDGNHKTKLLDSLMEAQEAYKMKQAMIKMQELQALMPQGMASMGQFAQPQDMGQQTPAEQPIDPSMEQPMEGQEPMPQEIPTMEQMMYGGQMYDFGGFMNKAGQGIANFGKGVADTALTMVGAGNVIQDSDYHGAGSKLAAGWANTVGGVGKAVLPMVANTIIPGSGAAVGAAQAGIGTMNPEQEQVKQQTMFKTSNVLPNIYNQGGYLDSVQFADGGGLYPKTEAESIFYPTSTGYAPDSVINNLATPEGRTFQEGIFTYTPEQKAMLETLDEDDLEVITKTFPNGLPADMNIEEMLDIAYENENPNVEASRKAQRDAVEKYIDSNGNLMANAPADIVALYNQGLQSTPQVIGGTNPSTGQPVPSGGTSNWATADPNLDKVNDINIKESAFEGIGKYAPIAGNLALGAITAFQKPQQLDYNDYLNKSRLEAYKMNIDPQLRAVEQEGTNTRKAIKAGASGGQYLAMLNNLNNQTATQRAGLYANKENADNQMQLEADKFNIGMESQNLGQKFQIDDWNARSKTAKQQALANYFGTAANQIGQVADTSMRNKVGLTYAQAEAPDFAINYRPFNPFKNKG